MGRHIAAASALLPRQSRLSRPHHAPLRGGGGHKAAHGLKKAFSRAGPSVLQGPAMAMVNNSLDEIDLAALKVSFVSSFSAAVLTYFTCLGSCWDFRSYGSGGKWNLWPGRFRFLRRKSFSWSIQAPPCFSIRLVIPTVTLNICRKIHDPVKLYNMIFENHQLVTFRLIHSLPRFTRDVTPRQGNLLPLKVVVGSSFTYCDQDVCDSFR